MRLLFPVTAAMLAVFFFSATSQAGAYAGSASCRECHAKFHELWSSSMHGLAMRPYSTAFADANLTAQEAEIGIGKYRYRADLSPEGGYVLEARAGRPAGRYRIEHVLGGKNVYYFLTSLERGRLQTLPVAYDVRKKEWFDAALSGVRHVPDDRQRAAPLSWKERSYTFNTSCYNCHVSQLAVNYDARTDTYRTTWTEPGINCETCHGSAAEHLASARTATGDPRSAVSGIIAVKTMPTAERTALCASCHAKLSPLTASFRPGDRFFDHFDLVTLEDPDYYPDGRDLGENYTFTSWLMSPCAGSGRLDCVHCHTSSGRYRFGKEGDANKACLPCHAERVRDASAHTRHKADSAGSRCVSCHMPMTTFARMNRSDHSMLPPTPATTLAYGSPNACNGCHSDKDPAWADSMVRSWWTDDYQRPVLYRSGLVDAARRGDWTRLGEMLAYLASSGRSEIVAVSLIRLLPTDRRAAAAFLKAAKDPSPLVRAAAVDALAQTPGPDARQAVLAATADDYRLVRVRAGAAIPSDTGRRARAHRDAKLRLAEDEFLASLRVRPDQWSSHYNRGNYHLGRDEPEKALAAYAAALRFEPRAVTAMVNASMACARLGRNEAAEEYLRKALLLAPENAAANFNMGLLLAAREDLGQAERHLRAALKNDPQMAKAAYNLCVITGRDRLDEAVDFCRKASELRPDVTRYRYTLAYHLHRKGETAEAVRLLNGIVKEGTGAEEARKLLDAISAAR